MKKKSYISDGAVINGIEDALSAMSDRNFAAICSFECCDETTVDDGDLNRIRYLFKEGVDFEVQEEPTKEYPAVITVKNPKIYVDVLQDDWNMGFPYGEFGLEWSYSKSDVTLSVSIKGHVEDGGFCNGYTSVSIEVSDSKNGTTEITEAERLMTDYLLSLNLTVRTILNGEIAKYILWEGLCDGEVSEWVSHSIAERINYADMMADPDGYWRAASRKKAFAPDEPFDSMFSQEFGDWYDLLYDNDPDMVLVAGLSDDFDHAMNEDASFKEYIVHFSNEVRGDFISSDREAAAAIIAWYQVTGEMKFGEGALDFIDQIERGEAINKYEPETVDWSARANEVFGDGFLDGLAQKANDAIGDLFRNTKWSAKRTKRSPLANRIASLCANDLKLKHFSDDARELSVKLDSERELIVTEIYWTHQFYWKLERRGKKLDEGWRSYVSEEEAVEDFLNRYPEYR